MLPLVSHAEYQCSFILSGLQYESDSRTAFRKFGLHRMD